MLDITKLKDNDRIKFSDETFGQITNYEIDISNLKGTVIECEDMIAIKLDKHFSDLANLGLVLLLQIFLTPIPLLRLLFHLYLIPYLFF